MQNAYLIEQGNVGKVISHNRIGHKNKFLIKNLVTPVVAHPILIIEVKQG